jgi:hypothetical protein
VQGVLCEELYIRACVELFACTYVSRVSRTYLCAFFVLSGEGNHVNIEECVYFSSSHTRKDSEFFSFYIICSSHLFIYLILSTLFYSFILFPFCQYFFFFFSFFFLRL